jgi:hypothetical protein
MQSAFIIATTPPSSRPQIAAVHTIRGVVETSDHKAVARVLLAVDGHVYLFNDKAEKGTLLFH